MNRTVWKSLHKDNQRRSSSERQDWGNTADPVDSADSIGAIDEVQRVHAVDAD